MRDLFTSLEFEPKQRGTIKYRSLNIHEKINLKSWMDMPYKWRKYGFHEVIWEWITRKALSVYHLDMIARPKFNDRNYVYDLITNNTKRG